MLLSPGALKGWGTLVSITRPEGVSAQTVSELSWRGGGMFPDIGPRGAGTETMNPPLPSLRFQFQPPDLQHLICKWDNNLLFGTITFFCSCPCQISHGLWGAWRGPTLCWMLHMSCPCSTGEKAGDTERANALLQGTTPS